MSTKKKRRGKGGKRSDAQQIKGSAGRTAAARAEADRPAGEAAPMIGDTRAPAAAGAARSRGRGVAAGSEAAPAARAGGGARGTGQSPPGSTRSNPRPVGADTAGARAGGGSGRGPQPTASPPASGSGRDPNAPSGDSWLDRWPARAVAVLIALGCFGALALMHWDDLRFGAEPQGDPTDPVAACLDERRGELESLVAEGLMSREQADQALMRNAAICEDRFGSGATESPATAPPVTAPPAAAPSGIPADTPVDTAL